MKFIISLLLIIAILAFPILGLFAIWTDLPMLQSLGTDIFVILLLFLIMEGIETAEELSISRSIREEMREEMMGQMMNGDGPKEEPK